MVYFLLGVKKLQLNSHLLKCVLVGVREFLMSQNLRCQHFLKNEKIKIPYLTSSENEEKYLISKHRIFFFFNFCRNLYKKLLNVGFFFQLSSYKPNRYSSKILFKHLSFSSIFEILLENKNDTTMFFLTESKFPTYRASGVHPISCQL